MESPQSVLRTARVPLLILLARAEYPQEVRRIRKAAKLPTAARFIRPCAEVLPAGKTLVPPLPRRDLGKPHPVEPVLYRPSFSRRAAPISSYPGLPRRANKIGRAHV